MRVLRLYHSAVVDDYRQRDRLLRDRHGHEMHLVSPPSYQEGGHVVAVSPRPDDVPIHVVGLSGPIAPNTFWFRQRQLESVIRQVRPDIVDIHEEPYSASAAGVLLAMRRVGHLVPFSIYTAQNLIDRRYPPPFSVIEDAVLARAAAAYPCSIEGGERLRRRGFAGPINVLPLGVTLPAPRAPRDGGPLRVGYVGRCEPYKGTMIALEAFAAAAEGNDATFTVVGDGSQLPELRARAAALGVAGRVTFAGAVEHGAALAALGELDVMLAPSLTTGTWKEQFGRVAAEAMAAGAVVIASDSGSLREVVADAGVLVPEGDTAQFARELRAVLEQPEHRDALAVRGRERAATHFTWEAVAAGMDRMYRGMVGVADVHSVRPPS